MTIPSAISFTEGTVNPPTPPAGSITLFTQTDDKVYSINSAAVVTEVGSSTPTSPGGSNGQLQFNASGSFGGSADLAITGIGTSPAMSIGTNSSTASSLTLNSSSSGQISVSVNGIPNVSLLPNSGDGWAIIVAGGNLEFFDLAGSSAQVQISSATTTIVNDLAASANVKLGSAGANTLGFYGSAGTTQQLVTFSTSAPTPTAVSPTLTGVYATDYTALQTFNDAVVADIAALATWAAQEHTACQSIITALEAINLVTD